MDNLSSLQDFTRRIRKLLLQPLPETHSGYLDLSLVNEINPEELYLENPGLPPYDPLAEVFRLLLSAVEHNYIDELRLGVNEVLKSLVRSATQDKQLKVRPYLERIKMIFLRSLQPDFTYKDLFWGYICECFLPVGKKLLTENMDEATEHFLDCMAETGKLAAHHDLHTDKLQQVFRILEVLAEELNNQQVVIKARDYRQTLED